MERIIDAISLLVIGVAALFGVHTYETETTPSATTTAHVLAVVDGDTIDVMVAGERERVRYIGIDTPEPYREQEPACYSREASMKNRELVAGQTVQLVADVEPRDDYGRLLRYVYVNEIFVNAILVRDGYATPLPIAPNTRHADNFYNLAQAAKQQERGLWGVCR